MDKKTLRKQFLEQRLQITDRDWHEKSQAIGEHIVDFCLKQKHVTKVFLFYGIDKEPMIQNCVRLLSKKFTIALPRVMSHSDIEFYFWDGDALLDLSRFHIKEPFPTAKKIKADEHTIVCVPNLVMDKKGYRLGYGKGYYDRFLEKHPEVISLAVNYKNHIVESLPRDSWDQKVKFLCSEERVEKVLSEE